MICFDLDDTLVDSDRLHVFAFQKAFKKYNLPFVDDKSISSLFGATGPDILRTLFPDISDKTIKRAIEEHNSFVVKCADKKFVNAFPGVKTTLKKLRKDYRLAVVSNSSHKEIIAILKAAEIDSKLFDVFVGNDDVNHGKPWPDEILCAEKLTHHEADYMVGDSPYDIISGKRAGCKTIAVLTGNYSRKKLKEENPDVIIKNLKEIPEVLKNGL